MMSALVRLGTRGSQLALYQANAVAALIKAKHGTSCEIVIIRTSGDRLQDAPLSELGGKRLFVKEIEDALSSGTIDLAVHSSKDMPAVLADGLDIAGVLPREDARDAVVLPLTGSSEAAARPLDLDALVVRLGHTSSIGTSSVRRIAQLARLFPQATFAPIRGNLDTRLRKLDRGDHDALVLASAGLRRLGFDSRISMALPATACIPAPGQGIIAVEIRHDDRRVRDVVSGISDPAAADALAAERALVEALGGGCQTPIGAYAVPVDGYLLELIAAVTALDGSRVARATARGPRADARGLGARVAERLIADGAADILEETRRSHAETAATRNA